ncbi:restriction endonuclease subunit S [Helicobacter pylori]
MIGPLSSQLNAIKWGEFKLGDLFEMERGTRLTKANRIKGTRPLVTAGYENYGVAEYISNHDQKVFKGNTITIDMFANAFYRYSEYSADDNILVLTPKFTMSYRIGLCVTARINAVLKAKFSYGKQYRQKDFNVTIISLPLKPTAKTQTLKDIDFHFMEKFIAELEQCRLAELEAYLKATGLSNTTLSNDEENALNVFNNSIGGNTPCGLMWQSFRLGDLFEIYTGRDIIIGQTQQGDIPLVSHQHENNGITKTIKEIYNRTIFNYKQTIALADRGVFLATTQNKDFHIGTRVKALVFKNGEQDKKTRLFFTTCINKNQIMFLDYSSNATNKLPNLTISLPTTKNGEIDFHFMHTFINALMKQTIQGVIQYSKAKIQATKEAISQEAPTPKDSLF